jgi:predicted kinase
MIFMFFGHPGAGKSTLAQRFGLLHGILSIDADHFMTADERRAVLEGRYTQQMRLANIHRYCEHVRPVLERGAHVALADGLPNQESRTFLRDQFEAGAVVFVLARTPRELWKRRLRTRRDTPVPIDLEGAEAYIAANWEAAPASFPHEEVVNGEDPEAVDRRLREIYDRWT